MTSAAPEPGRDLVVLVEDAEADVVAARRMLRKMYPAITLEHFPDAESLLATMAERNPAEWWPRLFLLDLNLPGRSGLELLEALAGSDWDPVPAVVLSGSASSFEVQRCYDAGAAGYLTKPVGGEHLTRTWETIGRYWFEEAARALPRHLTFQLDDTVAPGDGED